MKIQFDQMETKVLEHFKGGEGALHAKMYTDELGKFMLSRLQPNSSIGLHTHDTSSEIIYIFSGTAKAIYDGEEEILGAGDVHYCPKGHSHTLINTGEDELVIFAVIPEL